MHDILKKAKRVKLVIFDVDGVLTDGSLFISDSGEQYKAFHSRDGHGMQMLRDSGVHIAIITGLSSQVVAHRMRNLGIEHVYQGCHDKLPAFEELCEKLDLKPEQVAYVGDDVVDLPILMRVGLSVAVSDAHELVKEHSHWQTSSPGGRGAARELCELIMRAQGSLDERLGKYLR